MQILQQNIITDNHVAAHSLSQNGLNHEADIIVGKSRQYG